MRPLFAILCLALAGCAHAPTKAERLRSQHPNGYYSALTDTGSAEPVFYGGDLVFVDTSTQYRDLDIGMWVVGWNDGDKLPTGPHVIIASNGPLFVTKGINSRHPDWWHLTPSNYIGVVRFGLRKGTIIKVP